MPGVDLGVLKITQCADALSRLTDFARVEGVTLHTVEFTTDYAVQRGGVALNVDTLNKDALATGQLVGDVQRQIALITVNHRLNAQEVDPVADGLAFNARDVVLDQAGRIDHTGPNLEELTIGRRIQTGHLRRERHGAKAELLPFGDVIGHENAIAFAGQFGVHCFGAHVDVTARQVKVAEHLLVCLNAAFDIGVAFDELAEQTGLFGAQNAAQTAVRIDAVADKAQTLDLNIVAFENFKHQIDAVLIAANDTRLHPGRQAAFVAIGLGNGGGVLLYLRWVEHPALGGADQVGKHFVFDTAVAFKTHAVQRWQFDHGNNQRAATRFNRDRFEKARVLQVLVGVIKLAARYSLSTTNSGAGQDGSVIDALVAFNNHRIELVLLGRSFTARYQPCDRQHDTERCPPKGLADIAALRPRDGLSALVPQSHYTDPFFYDIDCQPDYAG